MVFSWLVFVKRVPFHLSIFFDVFHYCQSMRTVFFFLPRKLLALAD